MPLVIAAQSLARAAASTTTGPRRPGVATLTAAGCGTAIASVCAIGLYRIEHLLGGVWSATAVLVAALVCWALARVFGRLSTVVPSGAGLLAFFSRAFGRRAALVIATPYLVLCLVLVGVEASIVDALLARFLHLPAGVGAALFLVGTWAVCRVELRAGYLAQAITTWALLACLGGLSVYALASAAERGELGARLLPTMPGALHFASGVGQALFLFMGFELLTSQAEVARDPRTIGRALAGSVAVLAAFYATVSLGFSCLVERPHDALGALAPQLAIAEQTGSPIAVVLVVVVCLLASFTSWNGALLALSRLLYALGAQGLLPEALGRVEPRRMVARPALLLLLVLAALATLLVMHGGVLEPAILAAAVAAAVVYAAAVMARERRPFRERDRSVVHRALARGLAALLVALAVGVVVDAGAARAGTLLLLGAALAGALALALRTPARPRAALPAPTAPIGARSVEGMRPQPEGLGHER